MQEPNFTKMPLLIREAQKADIPQIQIIRNTVTENQLSNPALVTNEDCEAFMFERGKGWVAEVDAQMVGFAIVVLLENNVWALFLRPEFEKKGIGRQLHDRMIDWYFGQTKTKIWLGTAPNTRAELFYRKTGWNEIGIHGKGEIKFEMTYENWTKDRER